MAVPSFRFVALAVALAASIGAAWQVPPPIALRTPFPRVEGESLSAKKVVLPEQVKGRLGVLVFSFSREAGGPARCWTETYARIGLADADAAMYGVLMLSDIPWIFRGLAVSGIKSGIPVALHDRTVKVFTDDDAWRARLEVKSPSMPHLVLVDRAGRVRWLYSGPCDGAGEQRLREQLKILLADKTSLAMR